jgi:Glycosyl hydrolases family 2, sugar binding domain/Glycosyl hydrolases family 2/Glycosyl hydrolases family 2, TIM barrel domain
MVAAFFCLFPSLGHAKSLTLDGDWMFVGDPSGNLSVSSLDSASGIPIRVPNSWQAAFVDRRDYAGVAWYWRTVNLDAVPADQVLLLKFEAVDYRAEVYVNGQKAGSHDGGYLPFEFDVTTLVQEGDNQIAVRVTDPAGAMKEAEGIKYAEIPHGKQDWYVQTSGLWQSVELDGRPKTRLETVHVSADASGKFSIRVSTRTAGGQGASGSQVTVEAEILDPSLKSAWQGHGSFKAGEDSASLSGTIPNVSQWNLSSPSLYTLRTTLSNGDSNETKFGFRTFESRDGKFYLNGQPVYLRAALDQAFYPETIYTEPSLEYLREEMRKAKALGLNMLRCHIKVPNPRYLEAADEEGVLVWYEIPNWDKLTPDSERRGMETLRGMVDRDWNHPSIVIVSIINESWGIDLKNPPARAWLKEAYDQAKTLVPGWLVEDNSACCDNFHVKGDLADFHTYNSIPEHAADFDRFVGDFATRPRWLFSPYGDAAPTGTEPLVLSEFGNWGLPKLHRPEPWWFSRDFNGREITLPAGVERRFSDYQFGSLFKDYNALAEATQLAQYRSLKHEIGSLRIHPEIQGYVITEFTDINWEANGLLVMWREPKVYADSLRKIQQDDVVVARADRRNYFTGNKVRAEVYFSHYSASSLAGAHLEWKLEGTDLQSGFEISDLEAATSTKVGEIQFNAPAADAPSRRVLRVTVALNGHVLSEDSLDFYFYPPQKLDLPPAVSFHDPGGRLRRLVNEMQARGYQSPSGRETYPVMISSVWDEEVKKTLRNGGIVLLLASDPVTLAPGLEIVSRSKDNLDGNWISSFPWIHKDRAPFAGLGFETFPGFEANPVTPGTVVRGIPPQNFDDVLAGIFYGWIHSNVGSLVQAQYGKGKLLISTFSLGSTYGTDPYATRLLDAMMNYAVSRISPKFQIPQ